ncbi:MAG TPA: hypothetical protein VLG09_00345 [Candidatus Saccharimonadales bacterium]|nr:hypothetical protein [Candidatus Saccharimonadales bacterium]
MSNREPVTTRWRHSPETWAKRDYFVGELEKTCSDRGISVTWLDDEKWTGFIESVDGVQRPIYGYDLGLNPSAAGKIADSKADTYRLLRAHDIPAVRHERLSPNLSNGQRLGVSALTAMAIEAVGLPLVTKPDALASGGRGVDLCYGEVDVKEAIRSLTADGGVAAVSPYIEFDEYRAIILNNEVRAVIEKSKQPDGWMHNHSKGAEHRLILPTSVIHQEVGSLGVRAAIASGLTFTTVDVARSRNATQVLEINDAVSIVYPDDPELEEVARDVYGDAALLRLATN